MIDPKKAVEWFERWDLTPDSATYALKNYITLINDITGGRLSRLGYSAAYIENIADDYKAGVCEECAREMRDGLKDQLKSVMWEVQALKDMLDD